MSSLQTWIVRSVVAASLTGALTAQYSTLTRVDVQPGGAEADSGATSGRITPDGRFVTFTSYSTNLLGPNAVAQVLLLDRQTQQYELVSVGVGAAPGNWSSYAWSMTPDARFIAFASQSSNIVAGDTNGQSDAFVRDRQLGTTTRVSVDSAGGELSGASTSPRLSDDGQWVAFTSTASDVVPNDLNGFNDVFLKNLVTGQVRRINLSTSGGDANEKTLWMTMSGDAARIAYRSVASNLVAGDTNGEYDVFVTDTATGATQRVNVSPSGAEATAYADYPEISGDGSCVAFSTSDATMVAGDTNGAIDVFVRTLATGVTERVSLGEGNVQANSGSNYPQLSRDGRFVLFGSWATNLVTGKDANGTADVFIRDRLAQRTICASLSQAGEFVSAGSINWHQADCISANGRFAVFTSLGAGLVPNDTNHAPDVFVRDWLASAGPVAFCPSATTAGGCKPVLTASANPSATFATPTQLSVTEIDAQRNGLFFYGIDNAGFAPLPWMGGPSTLCVRAPVQRTPLQDSGGTASACDGSFQLDRNSFEQTNPTALGNPWTLGQHVYVQAWFRDPGSSATTALTNAIELVAQP